MPNSIEQPNAWRELREQAPEQARDVLTRAGLEIHIGPNTPDAVRQVTAELPSMIRELSYVNGDPRGALRNENRYLVRTLTNFHKHAERLQAANDNLNPLATAASE